MSGHLRLALICCGVVWVNASRILVCNTTPELRHIHYNRQVLGQDNLTQTPVGIAKVGQCIKSEDFPLWITIFPKNFMENFGFHEIKKCALQSFFTQCFFTYEKQFQLSLISFSTKACIFAEQYLPFLCEKFLYHYPVELMMTLKIHLMGRSPPGDRGFSYKSCNVTIKSSSAHTVRVKIQM